MITLRSNSYEGRYLELTVAETASDGAASTLSWVLSSTGGISSRYYVADTTVTIGGQTVYFYDAPYWSETTAQNHYPFPITTGQVRGTLTVRAQGSIPVTLSTRVYVSMTPEEASGVLVPAAPDTGQAAAITAAQGGSLGDSCLVQWTPQSRSHCFALSYTLTQEGGTVTQRRTLYRPGVTNAYQAKLPLPYDLAQAIPGDTRRELEITLTTYPDDRFDTPLEGDSRVTVTVTVPENDATRPQVTAALCRPDPAGSHYIQGKTGVLLESAAAQGRYGASIVSCYLRCEGVSYPQGTPSRPLAQWGELTVTVFARDSRGFVSQGYPVSLEALPYLAPKLRPLPGQSRVLARRVTAEGTPSDQGTYLQILLQRSYSPVVWEGVQQNFCTVSCRIRPAGSDAWGEALEILSPESTQDDLCTGPLLGTLVPGAGYQVELTARDTLLSQTVMVLTLAADRIYWHRDGARGSLGFGDYVREDDVFLIAQDKTLKIQGALALEGQAASFLLDLAHPIGSVLETVSPQDPGDTLGGSWEQMAAGDGTAKWRRTQ